MTNGPSGDAGQDEIYAIFRVFDLGRGSIGLKVFIDPEQHRQREVLSFVSDQYTVLPGPRYYTS